MPSDHGPAEAAASPRFDATSARGVRVAASRRTEPAAAIEEVAAALEPTGEIGFLMVFASPRLDADALAAAVGRRLPRVAWAGCSTAGEIGPLGTGEHGLVVVAFPSDRFAVVAVPLAADIALAAIGDVVAEARRRLKRLPGATEGAVFALTLLDGLCRREEEMLSTLLWALDEMPLVGGSSGDDLAFRDTFAFVDGRPMHGAGLLLMVRTTLPFRTFKSDHFLPTAKRLVVTACDPDERIVSELDAEPAADAFAAAAGLDAARLDGATFAAHPLLVRVGGDHYCRSIQKLNPDGSLSFYCAIDTGVVLTLAETGDMVAALAATLARLDDELGGIDFVLGFDCIHRRLEAAARGVTAEIAALLGRYRVVGFATYGEQFGAMHLNHTFTGVAFGRSAGA